MMPIKRVVCSICNQEVNKAQTYFVGNEKRACRSHEGVVEKKEQFEAKKVEQSQKEKNRENQRQGWRDQRKREVDNPQDLMKPKCWVCNVTGIRSQEFFMRVMIEREKGRQIYGAVNPFDLSHPANQHGIKEACIFVVEKTKAFHVIRFMRPELRSLPDMAGVVAICGQCAQKHNVEVLPKVELEQLIKFSVVSELVIQPVIEKIAVEEMKRDN